MEKLKVCLVNDSFPPLIDGVANAVVNYAEIINSRLGESVVATPQYPGADDDFPFPVVRYPSLDTMKLVGYMAGNPVAPVALHELETMRPDIVHSHCPITSTFFARLLRERTNTPIVFTYHTKFDIDIANAVRGKLVQEAAIKLLVDNISACDEVWVVSGGAGENLRGLGYSGDYIVMENGVDLPRGRVPQEETDALSAQYGLAPETPVFLFVGRIMWYKGLRLILDGLSRLKSHGQYFKMIFIGGGADKPEVEDYAKRLGLAESCVFTGPIHERETLRAWYCRADLLVFPSTFDTNGLVVREAAACSLPSLLVAGSAAAEGVEDGKTGILIEENDSAMAAALLRACDCREGLRRIGEAACEGLYMSWEDSVGRAFERYHIVVENAKSAGTKRRRTALGEFCGAYANMANGFEKLGAEGLLRREKLMNALKHTFDPRGRYL